MQSYFQVVQYGRIEKVWALAKSVTQGKLVVSLSLIFIILKWR